MNKSPSPLEQAVHWIVTGLVFLLPLAYLPAAFDIFGAPKIFLVRVAAAALAAIMLVLLGTGRLSRPANKSLMIAIAVYLLILIVSTAFSTAPITSLFGLRRRYFGLLTYVSELIIFLSLVLVTWRREQIMMLLKTLVASSSLVALIGIAESLGSTFPFDLKEQFAAGAYSTLGNPNFTGILLAMTLPLTVYLAVDSRFRGNDSGEFGNGEWRMANASRRGLATPSLARRVTEWKSQSHPVSPSPSLFGAAFLVQAAGLLATRSSGAIVGALLGLSVYALVSLFRRDDVNQRLLTAGVAAAVTILVVAVITLGSTESVSIGSRLRGWKASAKLIRVYPATGVGPDAMRYKMGRYLEPDKRYNQEIFEDGHNLLLTTAGTTGVAGLAAYLAVLAIAALSLWKDLGTGKGGRGDSGTGRLGDWASGGLALALLAALVAYLASEMINPDDIVPLTVFWVLVGMAEILRSAQDDSRPGTTSVIPAKAGIQGPGEGETGRRKAGRAKGARKASRIAVSQVATRSDDIDRKWWVATALPAVGATLILLYVAFANLGAELSLKRAEAEASFTPTVEAFKETQERFPYYDWYYTRLSGRLAGLVRQGDNNAFQIAEAAARQAIDLAPVESSNYFRLGATYRMRALASGEKYFFDNATANYGKAVALNPLNLEAVGDLAVIYTEAGDERKSREWIAKFAALAPDSDADRLRADIEAIKRDPSR